MTLPLPLRIALRDLRGGLRGFRVFVLCLMLGVAAIAAVGIVRDAIARALADQGAVLLGGDAQVSFTYRFALDEERAFLASIAARVSEIADFRSMAVAGQGGQAQRALTQVKAVDDAYPMTGTVQLDPPMTMAEALAPPGDLPGGVMDGVLADRLGLVPGDSFRLGTTRFRLTARLIREPDSAAAGFGLGPRSIVRLTDLSGSGLLEPGSLFDSRYRLLLPPGADLAALERRAEDRFRATGLRWQDSRRAAPGAERFLERMADFLVLVGLAALAVGGVGIASAVQDWLARRTETIAVLRALGAAGGTILAIFMAQVAVVAALGIGLGLALGAGLPMLAAPLIAAALPIPVAVVPTTGPLAEGALYGTLTALIFTLLPLSRVSRVRAAALLRDLGEARSLWPGARLAAALALLLAILIAIATALSDAPLLVLGTLGGIAGALALLALAAAALRRAARIAAHRPRLSPASRLALASVGSPRGGAVPVILSLGLGLSVLSAMGQIDANLRAAIDRDLPKVAPLYFFVDIQPDQIEAFRARLLAEPGVTRLEAAPMLRGIITRINGQDARRVAGDHWVLRGDRGVTYSETPPPGTTLTAGAWWPAGYSGDPQVSFAADEAAEMGLRLGDRLTVNILGRDIEATVTSLREVDFSTAGIGFIMAMTPAALAGAPHTHIATLYGEGIDEAALLRAVGDAWPNITAIRVRDVTTRVADALASIAKGTALAAGVTLLTGLVVLIGAAAAGEAGRRHEAALLKVLGATRARIRASFALRAALTGALSGSVAVAFGAIAGWAVMHFVMEAPFRFAPLPALAIVLGGTLAVLAAGLAFAAPALNARPAQVLRARD